MWLKTDSGEYLHTEVGAMLVSQSNEDGTGKVVYASSPLGGVRNHTVGSGYKDREAAQVALDTLMDNEGFEQLSPPDEEV
jgi:hypothetical protein